jgi:Holliday junction resolvase-like predicted endonuclease
MKNFFKARTVPLFETIALVAVIGFSMVGCDLNEKDYEMLNGDWDRGDIVITFNNDVGVFTEVKSNNGSWLTTLNYGAIHIGDQKFKKITKTGDLKWTCQELINDPPNTTEWKDGTTITMSANGQILSITNPNITYWSTTYTKK